MSTLCSCGERYAAQDAGAIIYSPAWRGWIVVDAPPRRMTAHARSLAVVRGSEIHAGEPLILQNCPWCAGELPPPLYQQGDGWAGEEGG